VDVTAHAVILAWFPCLEPPACRYHNGLQQNTVSGHESDTNLSVRWQDAFAGGYVIAGIQVAADPPSNGARSRAVSLREDYQQLSGSIPQHNVTCTDAALNQ